MITKIETRDHIGPDGKAVHYYASLTWYEDERGYPVSGHVEERLDAEVRRYHAKGQYPDYIMYPDPPALSEGDPAVRFKMRQYLVRSVTVFLKEMDHVPWPAKDALRPGPVPLTPELRNSEQ